MAKFRVDETTCAATDIAVDAYQSVGAMNEPLDLQIHTVYSADAEATVAASSLRLRILAGLALVVGIGWLYATCVPVWTRIEREVMVGEVMLSAFGSHANTNKPADEKSPTAPNPTEKSRAESRPVHEQRRATLQAQQRLGVITGVWMGMTILAGLCLVVGGVAGLVRPSRRLRVLGWCLTPVTLIVLGLLIAYVQREYAWLESILPRWVWPVMAGLVLTCAVFVGLGLQRRRVGLLRVGGVFVVLSACATVAALWTALRWGGLPSEGFDAMFYMKAFAMQSAFGWLLLLGTLRME